MRYQNHVSILLSYDQRKLSFDYCRWWLLPFYTLNGLSRGPKGLISSIGWWLSLLTEYIKQFCNKIYNDKAYTVIKLR